MKKTPFIQLVSLIFACILLSVSLATCAPAPQMAATLTLLPGTFTPLPPTPRPTSTRAATPTAGSLLGTASPNQTPQARKTSAAQTSSNCTIAYDRFLPSSDTPASFIGRHYDTQHLPAGLQLSGSGLLESNEYSWTHLRWENRDLYFVSKMICRDKMGKAYYEVADALLLPPLDTQAHEVVTDMCFQNDQGVPFAIAYGSYDPTQPAVTVASNFTGARINVKQAWQMTDRFVALDPAKLTCILQEPQGVK